MSRKKVKVGVEGWGSEADDYDPKSRTERDMKGKKVKVGMQGWGWGGLRQGPALTALVKRYRNPLLPQLTPIISV